MKHANLLPEPRRCSWDSGVCPIVGNLSIETEIPDPRIGRALDRMLLEVERRNCTSTDSDSAGQGHTEGDGGGVKLIVAIDPAVSIGPDAHRIEITPHRILVAGGSARGCFCGMQTLTQLLRYTGDKLPCGTIEDWSDFATRGLLHDVSRGKVPRLDTLKGIVDRLALLKINQFQLYIEHAFVFSFDPTICDERHGLTFDEVRELGAYCHERFIDLVPALATLGHMGRILSMPKYRHLAEIATTKDWSFMSWPERTRGFTLDCLNPEAHQLVKCMWKDLLDAFSSPVVNLCGDEPWDLGRGKNKDRLDDESRAHAYVDQIRRTHDICANRSRRCQVWSDVLLNHANLLDRLPSDLVILHWGYDDSADFEATKTFVDAGFETYVCPGTFGWKRILNAVATAERNISDFVEVGLGAGATGVINTDWGDHGHFHPLACSWHGIALGAAKSWRADHPIGERFDRAFAELFFDRPAESTDMGSGMRCLRKASTMGETFETWRLMWMPVAALHEEQSLPNLDLCREASQSALSLHRWCQESLAAQSEKPELEADLAELSIAARFLELFARKMVFLQQPQPGRYERDRRGQWAEDMKTALGEYEQVWLVRNKASGLDDIRRTLNTMVRSITEKDA